MTAPTNAIDHLARRIGDLAGRLDRIEAGSRVSQLSHSSLDAAALPVLDENQGLRSLIGRHHDGTYAISHYNGAPPPQPVAPSVSPRELSVVVSHGGTFADGEPPADLDRLQVHMAEVDDFTPSADTLQGDLPATGGTVSITADNDTHYVAVVALSLSGAASERSDTVEVTPLGVSNLAAGSIGAEQLAAVLTLSSRVIAGDPGGARVELNGSGFGAYNQNNNQTVSIDSMTGDVTITGELRTANRGRRIVVNPSVGSDDPGEIQFYVDDTDTNVITLTTGTVPDVRSGVQYPPTAGVALVSPTVNATRGTPGISIGPSPTIGFYSPDGNLRSGFQFSSDGTYLDYCSRYGATPGTWVSVFNLTQPGSTSMDTRLAHVKFNAAGTATTEAAGFSLSATGSSYSTVAFTVDGLYVENTTQTAYAAVYCSAVNPPSARTLKRNIQQAPSSPLTAVRNSPASTWTYTDDPDNTPHFGPMADDLPKWLQRDVPALRGHRTDDSETTPTTLGIDMFAMVGALWEAVRELDTEIDELRTPAKIRRPRRKKHTDG